MHMRTIENGHVAAHTQPGPVLYGTEPQHVKRMGSAWVPREQFMHLQPTDERTSLGMRLHPYTAT